MEESKEDLFEDQIIHPSCNTLQVSFQGCVAQFFFFHFLGCTECFLYTAMAYNHFLAICKPRHYSVIMKHRTCVCLAIVTWLGGSLHSTIQNVLTFQLPYGQENRVGYILCVIRAVLKLACGDTELNELVTFVDTGFLVLTSFLLILMSYVYIISAILRIHSAQGRHRTFSTYMAHVTVVVTYNVPGLFIYLRPGTWHPLDGVVAVFYTTVTPLLNFLIYTLRNKEMKDALMRPGAQETAVP